jgi:hypothetical protein
MEKKRGPAKIDLVSQTVKIVIVGKEISFARDQPIVRHVERAEKSQRSLPRRGYHKPPSQYFCFRFPIDILASTIWSGTWRLHVSIRTLPGYA